MAKRATIASLNSGLALKSDKTHNHNDLYLRKDGPAIRTFKLSELEISKANNGTDKNNIVIGDIPGIFFPCMISIGFISSQTNIVSTYLCIVQGIGDYFTYSYLKSENSYNFMTISLNRYSDPYKTYIQVTVGENNNNIYTSATLYVL